MQGNVTGSRNQTPNGVLQLKKACKKRVHDPLEHWSSGCLSDVATHYYGKTSGRPIHCPSLDSGWIRLMIQVVVTKGLQECCPLSKMNQVLTVDATLDGPTRSRQMALANGKNLRFSREIRPTPPIVLVGGGGCLGEENA